MQVRQDNAILSHIDEFSSNSIQIIVLTYPATWAKIIIKKNPFRGTDIQMFNTIFCKDSFQNCQ